MKKYPLALIPCLSLLLIGCATTDGEAVGRAAANTGLVAAAILLGDDGTRFENCKLMANDVERDACNNRNSDMKAATEQARKEASRSGVEDFDTYRARRDQELTKQ